MIVTGESSGELYGSLLASEIKKLRPQVRIMGVGGEKMRRAGVEVFSEIASAFGLAEAISSYRKVKTTLNRTLAILEDVRPEVVVLIDYPDFNFRVGKRAHELGMKVLYYVSPQVWAWRSGRVHSMAEFVDKMAVLLPFEEPLYKNSGIPCEFVGHPIMEEMLSMPSDKQDARSILGLEPEKPYLAVLPGSRGNELRRLLPLMLEVVRKFKAQRPEWGFVLPVAPNVDMNEYSDGFGELESEGVHITKQNAVLVFTASEAAVVASGTAALQAVLRETPLVVVYKVAPMSYLIGKMLIKVPFINLANIILGREAVPELIQGRANANEVMSHLRKISIESPERVAMLDDLRTVKAMFEGKQPSVRVAQMVAGLAGWQAGGATA